jgi:hypothetical protein
MTTSNIEQLSFPEPEEVDMSVPTDYLDPAPSLPYPDVVSPPNPYAAQEKRARDIIETRGDDLKKEQTGIALTPEIPVSLKTPVVKRKGLVQVPGRGRGKVNEYDNRLTVEQARSEREHGLTLSEIDELNATAEDGMAQWRAALKELDERK